MRTALLALSLIGNLGLALLWLAGAPERGAQADLEHTFVEGRVRQAPAEDSPEARRVLLAELEERELGAIANPWERFWQGADPALDYADAVRAAYGRIRAELERRYGESAARAPEFARAYRPLAAELSFLSSAEQLEIQRRRSDARRAQAAQASRGEPVATGSDVDLSFLAPAAAFEVRLRSSMLASLMRRSGVEFDEHEFRQGLALLEQAAESGDVRGEAVLRRELQELLGAERATRVLAIRDPLWPLVQRVAREAGLEPKAAAAAYAAASEAQTALLELAANGEQGRVLAEAAAAIAATERARLVATLGETAAGALFSAREAMRPDAAAH